MRDKIIGFAEMAAKAEENHKTVLSLDLSVRNNEPVYKAIAVIEGKRILVSYNAVSGAETDRQEIDEYGLPARNGHFEYMNGAPPDAKRQSVYIPLATYNPLSGSTVVQIPYERAREIAVNKVGGGSIKEVDYNKEDGRPVYTVIVSFIGRRYEVRVDAMTGGIIKYKADE